MTYELRDGTIEATIVASISGGKDSTAMSLWLTEHGLNHRRVFADTGWEHPATYEYLKGVLQKKLGPIDVVQSPIGGMREWILKKGMFPNRLRRFCTQLLKIEPLAEYMAHLDGKIVNAVGVRANESRARSRLPEREPWSSLDGVEVWRPLLHWTEQHVIETHHRHGLKPNPLYLRGAARVGCWPCIFARKSEIRLVAETTPWRINEIRELERCVQEHARMRYEKRGETFESLGYKPPCFFQPSRDGMKTIDEMVNWSKTSHGGVQLTMPGYEPPTCVRWGLCGD